VVIFKLVYFLLRKYFASLEKSLITLILFFLEKPNLDRIKKYSILNDKRF
tara:strand:- start:400 stop:549 length:150 start_codon:yes stop_codon:yes gene_type:complete